MIQRLKDWFPKGRDFIALEAIVILIGFFCFFGLPEEQTVWEWLSAPFASEPLASEEASDTAAIEEPGDISPSDEASDPLSSEDPSGSLPSKEPSDASPSDEAEGTSQSEDHRTFLTVLAATLVALPAAMFALSKRKHGNFAHAWIWLRFLWISFAITFGLLTLKVLVFDDHLSDLKDFYEFSGSLPAIFSFGTTLYSFVAGFILFYSLQEHSSITRDFKQEIGAWHGAFDLLRFFQRDKDAPKTKIKERAANHLAALDGMRLIKDIDVTKPEHTPEKSLDALYNVILRLKALDDNDKPALEGLMQKYTMLRILLHQRRDRSVQPPSMLILVVWAMAIIIAVFALIAVLSLFVSCADPQESVGGCLYDYGPGNPLERLYLALAVTAVVFPVTMINLTISDLANPFGGEWKIDVKAEYDVQRKELEAALLRSQNPPKETPYAIDTPSD